MALNLEKIANSKLSSFPMTRNYGGVDMTKRNFTYLTEFSGLGGASLGCRQAGGIGKLAIEWDPCDRSQNAYQHLVLNFPEMHKEGLILNKDITTISGDEMLDIMGIPSHTLNIFQTSFPCQGFSMSNTARDVEDERNNLFYNSLEHISKIMPDVVIGENVGGLGAGVMKQGVISHIILNKSLLKTSL